jgi:hypothetical protein
MLLRVDEGFSEAIHRSYSAKLKRSNTFGFSEAFTENVASRDNQRKDSF